jgi:RNA polymerase sigma factor (sigma-70 family)
VRRAQQGDRGAFREIYHRYHAWIFHLFLLRGAACLAAWDLSQATFRRAFLGIQRLEARSTIHLGRWLGRIATRVWIDHRVSKIGASQPLPDLDTSPPSIPDSLPHRVDTIDATEDAETGGDYDLLYECLDHLSPELRQIVVGTFFFDMNAAQLAEWLGCASGTIMDRRRDGLEQLRDCLALTRAGAG